MIESIGYLHQMKELNDPLHELCLAWAEAPINIQ